MKVLSLIQNSITTNSLKGLRTAKEGITETMLKMATGKRSDSRTLNSAELTKLEKIGAQIAGIDQSIRNVADAHAHLEVAETALLEISDMLTRISEIAIQASNSSLTASDRTTLENEAGQLKSEIDALAFDTSFNQRRLLSGSFTGFRIQNGENAGNAFDVSISAMDVKSLGAYVNLGPTRAALAAAQTVPDNTTTDSEDITISTMGASYTIDVSANDSAKEVASKINGITGTTGLTAEAKTHALLFSTSGSAENYTISLNGTSTSSFSISTSSVSDAITKINAITPTTGVTATTYSSNKVLLTDTTGEDITIENTASGTNLDFQAIQFDGLTTQGSEVSLAAGGSTNNDASRVIGTVRLSSGSSFSITQAGNSSLAYSSTNTPTIATLSSISFSSSENASDSVAIIKGSLERVFQEIGNIGAAMTRLTVSDNFLANFRDRLDLAVSSIEDIDFAAESAKLAKSLVLQRAGTALLAQANAGADLVLRLIGEAA